MADHGRHDELDQGDDVAALGDDRDYPVDRLRRRIGGTFGGRPLMVYLVLFAGAAVLLILLIIVWVSATGGGDEERPPCFDITADEARAAIDSGSVERIDIFRDKEQPEIGPSVVRLYLNDDSCRELPKGADNVGAAYFVIGVANYYNSTHEVRIRIRYQGTSVLPEFLVTSTPTPTVTPTPTETPTPTPTDTPAPASPTAFEEPIATTEPPTPTPSPAPPLPTSTLPAASPAPPGG